MIHGIGIVGYRSFYGDLQLIGPFSKVNLFAGQNNAGKSNVLRFINEIQERRFNTPSGLDIPQPPSYSGIFEWALAVPWDDPDINAIRTSVKSTGSTQLLDQLDQLFRQSAFRLTNDDFIWIRYTTIGPRGSRPQISARQVQQVVSTGQYDQFLNNLASAIAGERGSTAHNLEVVLRNFNPIDSLSKVFTIEAFRQIREDEKVAEGVSGQNLIAQLNRLQNPEVGKDFFEREGKFRDINRFLQAVLEGI